MDKKYSDQAILSLPPGARVLDAGCGSGNISRYLLARRPDLRITGLDIDPACRALVPQGVSFVQGSILDLKRFKAASFDAVTCFHLLEHLIDPRRAVREMERVLKPGGTILAECPHWVCAFLPIGSNFYDDPTHVRPHSKASFRELFNSFEIGSLEVDEPVMFFMQDLYGIPVFSGVNLLRKALSLFGLFRIAVFLGARKPAAGKGRVPR